MVNSVSVYLSSYTNCVLTCILKASSTTLMENLPWCLYLSPVAAHQLQSWEALLLLLPNSISSSHQELSQSCHCWLWEGWGDSVWQARAGCCGARGAAWCSGWESSSAWQTHTSVSCWPADDPTWSWTSRASWWRSWRELGPAAPSGGQTWSSSCVWRSGQTRGRPSPPPQSPGDTPCNRQTTVRPRSGSKVRPVRFI